MTDRRTYRVGWLLDGRGGPALEDRLITVRSGRIERIGPGPEAGPEAVDLAVKTIIPGLIDAHVHLFMSPAADPKVREHQLDATYDQLRPIMAEHARAYLRAGVTAVRDGGDYGGYSLRFRDEADRPGLTIRSPGRAFHAPDRYGRLIGRPPRSRLTEAVAGLEEPIDHLKLVNSGINSLVEFGRETKPQFAPGELKSAIRAAHERGFKVMVHANGRQPVREALLSGADSIEHGFFMGRANLELMAEQGCVWVPTAVTMAGYGAALAAEDPRAGMARRILDHQLDQLATARKLGVRCVCGSDTGSLGVGPGAGLAWEVRLFMMAGYGFTQALAGATVESARLLGLEPGLVRGGPATWAVYDGPPDDLPEHLGRPEAMVVEGRLRGEVED